MPNSGIYSNFYNAQLGGLSGYTTTSLLTANLNCILLTSAYTPNQTAHVHYSDVSAYEVVGTGYTAGGLPLTGKNITVNTLFTTLSGSNVTWTSATISARYACLYLNTGTATTSPLVALLDFGSTVSSNASNFSVNWNASGILSIDVPAFS